MREPTDRHLDSLAPAGHGALGQVDGSAARGRADDGNTDRAGRHGPSVGRGDGPGAERQPSRHDRGLRRQGGDGEDPRRADRSGRAARGDAGRDHPAVQPGRRQARHGAWRHHGEARRRRHCGDRPAAHSRHRQPGPVAVGSAARRHHDQWCRRGRGPGAQRQRDHAELQEWHREGAGAAHHRHVPVGTGHAGRHQARRRGVLRGPPRGGRPARGDSHAGRQGRTLSDPEMRAA